MGEKKVYMAVYSFAPRDEGVTVFFKAVGEKKSDGFAVVNNGKVFVIDVGRHDRVIRFLASLRESWLGDRLPEGSPAKLEITLIVSHAHGDHMGALSLLLSDERFCVTEIYAPCRSRLGDDVPGALPPLVREENRLENWCGQLAEQGHTAAGITRVPFGKSITLPMDDEDAKLTIYPSMFDWAEDRPSEKEGLRYILSNNPEGYKDNEVLGYTNGILNGNSLWVKVTKGERAVLITGDQRSTDEMLNAMIRYYGEKEFSCDVLKLTHHGEENYPTYLLSVAKPKIAVFTTSYEKAKRETVELCEEMRLTNYYTCDGELIIHTDGKQLRASGIEPR